MRAGSSRCERVCFVCKGRDPDFFCGRDDCPKGYHAACVGRTQEWARQRERGSLDGWHCSWHWCAANLQKGRCVEASVHCLTCPRAFDIASLPRYPSFIELFAATTLDESEARYGVCEDCSGTMVKIDRTQPGDMDDGMHAFASYWDVLKRHLDPEVLSRVQDAKDDIAKRTAWQGQPVDRGQGLNEWLHASGTNRVALDHGPGEMGAAPSRSPGSMEREGARLETVADPYEFGDLPDDPQRGYGWRTRTMSRTLGEQPAPSKQLPLSTQAPGMTDPRFYSENRNTLCGILQHHLLHGELPREQSQAVGEVVMSCLGGLAQQSRSTEQKHVVNCLMDLFCSSATQGRGGDPYQQQHHQMGNGLQLAEAVRAMKAYASTLDQQYHRPPHHQLQPHQQIEHFLMSPGGMEHALHSMLGQRPDTNFVNVVLKAYIMRVRESEAAQRQQQVQEQANLSNVFGRFDTPGGYHAQEKSYGIPKQRSLHDMLANGQHNGSNWAPPNYTGNPRSDPSSVSGLSNDWASRGLRPYSREPEPPSSGLKRKLDDTAAVNSPLRNDLGDATNAFRLEERDSGRVFPLLDAQGTPAGRLEIDSSKPEASALKFTLMRVENSPGTPGPKLQRFFKKYLPEHVIKSIVKFHDAVKAVMKYVEAESLFQPEIGLVKCDIALAAVAGDTEFAVHELPDIVKPLWTAREGGRTSENGVAEHSTPSSSLQRTSSGNRHAFIDGAPAPVLATPTIGSVLPVPRMAAYDDNDQGSAGDRLNGGQPRHTDGEERETSLTHSGERRRWTDDLGF